jgi:hypothetical protein
MPLSLAPFFQRVTLFFLLKALFFLSRFFQFVRFDPQGACFPLATVVVPVTSSYSSITLREPMMSCLTWEAAVGERAPSNR